MRALLKLNKTECFEEPLRDCFSMVSLNEAYLSVILESLNLAAARYSDRSILKLFQMILCLYIVRIFSSFQIRSI